ncbi:MAG: methylenetetrahydrofolate reductase (NADPH) [Candidatus Magnetoglobus multicellularis str. Araruama]|uniref:Methylenetetrahydrofolate reductase n=1 Tax=Candidatus Magnetoglobus multicellularis str. Araruama TaxID=890399 RepID=A0A1V1P847_9BACT|nr:MAG: methylenetetrahydrofolate reductase (NADPH) [Candidatus Magnetoglobus multicellularis str. Araruama]
MRVSDLYQNNKNVISMEFFPPRNEKAAQNFGNIIDNLSALKPDYMSITFGAGGSTRDGSYQTVKQVMIDKKQPTVAYIAGYGLGPDDIKDVLNKYKDLGVETIFVIRGDKPKEGTFVPHPDSFSYASEMIAFIKKHYDFTLGCAGYPEGHIEAESLDKDIEYLKLKVDNGAEYVVCQYFYDNQLYFDFVEKCRAKGIDVPIIPGVMPVYTVKMTQMLSKVCGSSITDALQKELDAVDADNKDSVIDMGIQFAFDQCKGLLQSGVPGLHFYTMNRSKTTTEIINRLKQENLL